MKSHYHCVYELTYHLVLVTKYRKKCFNEKMLLEAESIFSNLCTKWECELIEFNGEQDHVHLLFSAHPAMQLSKFVNNIKTVSSRLLRKNNKAYLEKFYWKPTLWTRAYCILSTGGASIEVIKKYIQSQGQ
ncbi:MAG: IS200/IS605 family transposase [Chitinophagales bacterium]